LSLVCLAKITDKTDKFGHCTMPLPTNSLQL